MFVVIKRGCNMLKLPQPAARVRGAERLAQRGHLRVFPPQDEVGELDDRRHLRVARAQASLESDFGDDDSKVKRALASPERAAALARRQDEFSA